MEWRAGLRPLSLLSARAQTSSRTANRQHSARVQVDLVARVKRQSTSIHGSQISQISLAKHRRPLRSERRARARSKPRLIETQQSAKAPKIQSMGASESVPEKAADAGKVVLRVRLIRDNSAAQNAERNPFCSAGDVSRDGSMAFWPPNKLQTHHTGLIAAFLAP